MINKKLVKKTAAITITGALAIAMTATVMAGPGGPGGPGGGMQGGPGQEMQGSSTGERPEMPSGEEGIPRDSSDASKPDSKQMSPGHLESPDTEVGGRGEAPTGERPKMPGGKGGEQTGQMKDNKGMPGMNTDDIKTAVEALEDENVKAGLETLISDYEAAKTAMEEAVNDESEDIDTFREAEMKAMEALRIALEEAGINTRPEMPEENENRENGNNQEGRQEMKQNGNTQGGQRSGLDNNTEYQGQQGSDSNSSSDNIFESIGKWFMSLFSR